MRSFGKLQRVGIVGQKRSPLVVSFALLAIWANPSPAVVIQVDNTVVVSDVKRLGINVGSRDHWAAAQILTNLIDNPGFEPGVYGMVAHARTGSTGTRFVQDFWDTTWNNDPLGIGQPVGFWDGAEWEIVYGPGRGRSGTVTSFTHETNRYVYYLDPPGVAPNQWDVMFVRRPWTGIAGGTQWSTPDSSVRPGSPGRQSMHLVHTGQAWRASYNFYMDSYWRDGDTSAGKMLIVEGSWHVEFWARGLAAGDQLRVRFLREDAPDFLGQTITLDTAWQRYAFDFTVAPGVDRPTSSYGPTDYHAILGLLLIVPNVGDEVWVDDVVVRSNADQNPTVFRDAYLDRLRELRPGILRNWSNQFGSDLATQIAVPSARGTQGYRPHTRVPGEYSYSLGEFLELCREVGAEPWYVVPPTFSTADLIGLIEYLASPADAAHPWATERAAQGQVEPWTTVFPTIHLEFGNELWGAASGSDPFMGASLLGGVRLGVISHDRFGVMRSHPDFDPARFNLIIGGQAGFPGRQGEIEANSFNHDAVALAPYFGELTTWVDDEEIFGPLLARPLDDVGPGRVAQSQGFLDAAGQGTQMAIYEVNFHTTSGLSPIDVRNDYLTSGAGALALPLHMLTALRAFAVRDQCAFTSLGYSYRMSSGEYARVWGVLRDLSVTGRRRPTWLGLELVNRAIGGDLITSTVLGQDPSWSQPAINGVSTPFNVSFIQHFAFRQGGSLGVILFNLDRTTAHPAEVEVPAGVVGAAQSWQIAPASIHDDNEDGEAVTTSSITPTQQSPTRWAVTLPPHSLTVLRWDGCARPAIQPVVSLLGVRVGGDVALSWQADTAADGYNVWSVSTPSLIPMARAGGVGTLVPGCNGSGTACVHSGATAPLYYQVRGACSGQEAAE